MRTPQIPTTGMKVSRFAMQLQYAMITLVLISVCPGRALAEDGHSHTMTQDQKRKAGALIKMVRESTERFKDVGEAEREHYSLMFGCVSGPNAGAMGLHFVNGEMLDEVNKSGVFDATRPQIVLYEPTANGVCDCSALTFWFSPTRGMRSIRMIPAAHGTAFPFVRQSESLWAASVLHAACLGMEGEP